MSFHLKALLAFTNQMCTFGKMAANKEDLRSKQNVKINSLISETLR